MGLPRSLSCYLSFKAETIRAVYSVTVRPDACFEIADMLKMFKKWLLYYASYCGLSMYIFNKTLMQQGKWPCVCLLHKSILHKKLNNFRLARRTFGKILKKDMNIFTL